MAAGPTGPTALDRLLSTLSDAEADGAAPTPSRATSLRLPEAVHRAAMLATELGMDPSLTAATTGALLDRVRRFARGTRRLDGASGPTSSSGRPRDRRSRHRHDGPDERARRGRLGPPLTRLVGCGPARASRRCARHRSCGPRRGDVTVVDVLTSDTGDVRAVLDRLPSPEHPIDVRAVAG